MSHDPADGIPGIERRIERLQRVVSAAERDLATARRQLASWRTTLAETQATQAQRQVEHVDDPLVVVVTDGWGMTRAHCTHCPWESVSRSDPLVERDADLHREAHRTE